MQAAETEPRKVQGQLDTHLKTTSSDAKDMNDVCTIHDKNDDIIMSKLLNEGVKSSDAS